jgi:hypothetical protein
VKWRGEVTGCLVGGGVGETTACLAEGRGLGNAVGFGREVGIIGIIRGDG